MRLLGVLLTFIASSCFEYPEFDDVILGRLIVSKARFPFLTLKDAPEMAYVAPNDEQLDVIRAAVGGRRPFAFLAARQDPSEVETVAEPSQSLDPWLDFARMIAELIVFEYSSEVLKSEVIDPGTLPFDRIHQDSYFSTTIINMQHMNEFMDHFNTQIRNVMKTKPWVPAETIVQEMSLCNVSKYHETGEDNFRYDKLTGGSMVYYRAMCMRYMDDYFLLLSTYHNDFKLRDIKHVDTIRTGWRFFNVTYVKTKLKYWSEAPYITAEEKRNMTEYMTNDFVQELRKNWQKYLTLANITN